MAIEGATTGLDNRLGTVTGTDPAKFTEIDPARRAFAARNTIKNSVRYPLNLEEESPHYVVFYPLVRENSRAGKLLKKAGRAKEFDQSQQNRAQPGKQGEALAAAGMGAGAALGIADALKNAGGVNASNSSLGGTAGKVLGVIGKGALGGATGAAAGGLVSLAFEEQAVLEGAGGIALQISERLSSQYRAGWAEGELGTLAGSVASGNRSLLEAANPFSPENIRLGLRSAGKVAQVLGSNAENLIAATTKQVTNPYKEQLFKSMDNRRFTFDYVFAPRNEAEAKAVFDKRDGIIQKFAYHMHPELSSSGYFFNFPSEFSIIYYYAGKENPYVRKVSTCVLTNMSIDYGAEGFTTFANGMPSYATMRLEFLELELLTTQRVLQGF